MRVDAFIEFGKGRAFSLRTAALFSLLLLRAKEGFHMD